MVISGFTGPYHLPDNVLEKTDHLVHITAGSGSVPNWAMLKHAVTHVPQLKHTFIYSNKTWEDIIFRDALNAFCARHPDKVRLVHCLTRQDVPEGAAGRNQARPRELRDLLTSLIPDPTVVQHLACGPALSSARPRRRPREGRRARAALHGNGVGRGQGDRRAEGQV